MAQDTFSPGLVGSTDWSGGVAPAGGTHTGAAVITMADGQTFTVAHTPAEVQQKLDPHAVAPVAPRWVAFDVPNRAIPAILNVALVATVTTVAAAAPPAPPPTGVLYPELVLYPSVALHPVGA